jgi:hypothetical protein
LVVVSVTVVTEVTVVDVGGAGVSEVVGGAVVVGVTVVVTVVGGAGASLLLGAGFAVWVVGAGGGGASLVAGDDDEVAAELVEEVPAGLLDDPALVNDTMA